MEFLKSIFEGAALTYDQLAEKLKGSADVKLANLASGQYVDKGKFCLLYTSPSPRDRG